MIGQLKKTWHKNIPELLEILKGNFPGFVTQRKAKPALPSVPVFVFHSVEPEHFEAQLRYLKNNNYKTVNADELEELAKGGLKKGNEIALTFDDATWSFWVYAYPLLVKYNFQAILFAIPGIVPDIKRYNANLRDYWEERCKLEELQQRAEKLPLCTWDELVEMHRSGHVDIQSHSLNHARVPISDVVIDFLHPAFDTDFYGNVNIPLSSLDDKSHPERALCLGAPVFQNVSRMACRPMYMAHPKLIDSLKKYVTDQGNEQFFRKKDWKNLLHQILKSCRDKYQGTFENQAQAESEVIREFSASKELLESKLDGKSVKHFCYPWFQGSARSDELAGRCGYHTVHYGFCTPDMQDDSNGGSSIIQIKRISEDFLFRLPGNGRKSLLFIWLRRLTGFKSRLKESAVR
ncbi:MAG: polysaccharide deacetylase family protein [Gammaproteobacteria bacterium]|nr:polysaccharide deacetylase family protein [Gammaproteobacteria bacterium]